MRLSKRVMALLLMTVCFAAGVSADDTDTSKTADGLTVYLGVLPAAMIQGHPQEHEESTMHGGVPRGKDAYHVMVAVFDAESGERIEDARVEAELIPLGLAPVKRPLEVMDLAGVVTYGNYFSMPGNDHYRIVVSITRPSDTKPVTVEFHYEHPTP